MFCKYKYLIRGPHALGSQQHNYTRRTPAEHWRESRASFSLMLAHLGVLGRHVGPLGRHLVPLARHLIANMSENVQRSSKAAPKMPQTPLPSLLKFLKNKKTIENHGFFNVFRLPAHLLKSSKNAPRTAPEAPKLSSKCPSWRYHAAPRRYHGPSWRHHGPSRTRLDAILAPTSIILRPSSAPSSREVPTKAHQRSQEPHQERPRSFQPPVFFDFRPPWLDFS